MEETISEDEMQLVRKRYGRYPTSHLILYDMDWDCFKAQDLVLFFNSFKPSRGVRQSAAIYTSLTEDYRTGHKMNCKLAVLTCDPVQTACRICIQCDGMECESTTGKLYFEFVPDGQADLDIEPDMVLYDMFEQPSSVVCDMPDKEMYKPSQLSDFSSRLCVTI